VEVIEVIRMMPGDMHSAVKYVLRRGLKIEPGLTVNESVCKELDKAVWYLNDEINLAPYPNLAPGTKGILLKLLRRVCDHEPNERVKEFLDAVTDYLCTGERKETLQHAIKAVQTLRKEYE
jgi:hypothetical protein